MCFKQPRRRIMRYGNMSKFICYDPMIIKFNYIYYCCFLHFPISLHVLTYEVVCVRIRYSVVSLLIWSSFSLIALMQWKAMLAYMLIQFSKRISFELTRVDKYILLQCYSRFNWVCWDIDVLPREKYFHLFVYFY